MTEIPKLTNDDWGNGTVNAPGWIQPVQTQEDGSVKLLRPIIRCNCGRPCGIGLHHVHADGTVTASFFHDSTPHPEISYPGGGCGWHVFLKLKDYDGGEFLPNA